MSLNLNEDINEVNHLCYNYNRQNVETIVKRLKLISLDLQEIKQDICRMKDSN